MSRADAAAREREIATQAALAELRAAEAAVEKQRAIHTEHSERPRAVQGRYYQVGADTTRLSRRCSMRASCASASAPTSKAHTEHADSPRRSAATSSSSPSCAPSSRSAAGAGCGAAGRCARGRRPNPSEARCRWQQRWEAFTRGLGAAEQRRRSSAPASSSWRTGRRLGAQASAWPRSTSPSSRRTGQRVRAAGAGRGTGARRQRGAAGTWRARTSASVAACRAASRRAAARAALAPSANRRAPS